MSTCPDDLSFELACVKFQRDALLEMTWLDLPAEPDEESTKEWKRLFDEGWERRIVHEQAMAEAREIQSLMDEEEYHAFVTEPLPALHDYLKACKILETVDCSQYEGAQGLSEVLSGMFAELATLRADAGRMKAALEAIAMSPLKKWETYRKTACWFQGVAMHALESPEASLGGGKGSV